MCGGREDSGGKFFNICKCKTTGYFKEDFFLAMLMTTKPDIFDDTLGKFAA